MKKELVLLDHGELIPGRENATLEIHGMGVSISSSVAQYSQAHHVGWKKMEPG